MTKVQIQTVKLTDEQAEAAERDAGLIIARLRTSDAPTTQAGSARTMDAAQLLAAEHVRHEGVAFGVFRLVRLYEPPAPPDVDGTEADDGDHA